MSSAVIGVAGTVALGVGAAGAAATAYGASQAAGATRDATNAAINQQNTALGQQAALSQPYRDLGQSAIPTLQGLLGLNGQDPTKALQNTPGYQFAKQQGLDSTVNKASAMGMGLSGNTLQGLDQFSTGLADQTYQQAVGNAENVVGLGQAAAAGQAANIGNAAANTSNLIMNQGNTQAGIDANLAAGLTKSFGAGANQYMMMNTLAGLNSPGGAGSGYDPTNNPYGPGSVGQTTDFGMLPVGNGGSTLGG